MKRIERIGNEIEHRAQQTDVLDIPVNVPLPKGVSPLAGRDGIAVFPVECGDGAGVSGNVALLKYGEPEGIVFVVDVDEIVFPYLADIEDAGKISDDVATQQVLVVGVFRCGDDACGAMAVLVYLLIVRIDDGGADVVEKRQLLRQLLGQPHIVAVKEGDVLSLGIGDALISRGARQSGVVLAGMEGDSGIFLRILLGNVAGAVGAVVVDDDQFPVSVCLCNDRINSLSKISF